MKVYIETKRLILRELLDSDIKGIFELDSDPEVHKYLGNSPIKTIDEAQKAIDYIRMQYSERGIGRWAVVNKVTGEFMGWSGLKLNTKEESYHPKYFNFYDVGYRFIKRFWGQGYATESGIAAVNYGFNTMNLEVINAITELGNIASHKALLKIGLNFLEDYKFSAEGNEYQLRWYEIKNPSL